MKKNDCPAASSGHMLIKYLLLMKLAVIITFITSFQALAFNATSQKSITLDLKSTSISVVLEKIEKKYDYRFFYNEELGLKSILVDVNVKNASIDFVLQQLLHVTPFSYKKINDVLYAIIGKNSVTAFLPITGRITDVSGNPVSGASVIEKGTSNGTVSADDGSFSINVKNDDAVLVISRVGYSPVEIAVRGNTSPTIVLSLAEQNMEELVVVGYGTVRRRDLTGSISTVTTDASKHAPAANPVQLLQGQAAGVVVTSNSGAPGSTISITIRGLNSFGDNQPLYVIDGIPLNEGEWADAQFSAISNINPNDIETINILKDASATAIYGSRAANGVVLITTKHGKQGKSIVTINSSYGFQSPTKKVELMNARQFADFQRELYGDEAKPQDSLANLYDTDWQDIIFRKKAPIQSHQIGISGGTEKTQFGLSGGYFNQRGLVITSGMERYTVKLNLDHRATKWLKLGTNINLSRVNNDVVVTNNQFTSPLMLALINQPTQQPGKISEGVWHGASGGVFGEARNPLAILTEEKQGYFQNSLLGNLYGEVNLLKGLLYRTSISQNISYTNSFSWTPTYIAGINGNTNTGAKSEGSNYYSYMVYDNTLSYSINRSNHDLNILLGSSAEKGFGRYLAGGTNGFYVREVPDMDLGDGASPTRYLAGGRTQSRLLSYFARANYNYLNKYYFTGTVRRDGSDKFGPDNKWGTFPSASVAWVLSQEEFLKNSDAITYMKLRASYGLTGNQKIGQFAYLSTVGGWGPDSRYSFGPGPNVVTGKGLLGVPNLGIRWESTKQLDLGTDISLWDRVHITADYYNKLTDGLLIWKPIPITTGFYAASVNLGAVRNTGVELSVNSENIRQESFTWNTNFNISFNRNRIESLESGLPVETTFTRSEEGQPIGQFYGLVVERIFKDEADAAQYKNANGERTYPNATGGDIMWKDINGDGNITDADRTYIGNPHPKFIYGLGNTVNWKGFDLFLLLQGVQGNSIYYGYGNMIERMTGYYNSSARVLNRWTPANMGTNIPRAVNGDPNSNGQDGSMNGGFPTSRWIENGSYFRFKTLTLGYSIPQTVLNRLKLSNLRIYVSGDNIITFTKYPGYSPEIGFIDGSTLDAGIDYGVYPVARSIVFGLNITF